MYARVKAVQRSDTLDSHIRAITQLFSVTLGSTIFPTTDKAFNFLFQGKDGNDLRSFIIQLQSGNAAISVGPIMENTDKT